MADYSLALYRALQGSKPDHRGAFSARRTECSVYTARLARSGEHLERDWALLRLEQLLPPHLSSPLTLTAASPSLLATAAGYSKHLQEGRERLSYDSNCRWVSAQEWQDCFTSKGTSGGPVVQTIADEPTIVGIISQGNGEGMTLTFPVDLLPPF